VTAACGQAAKRADQIAVALRFIADNQCPAFGRNGEVQAKVLRDLADGLRHWRCRLRW
jgi:hypothetical protein